jgi:hypothetical protein
VHVVSGSIFGSFWSVFQLQFKCISIEEYCVSYSIQKTVLGACVDGRMTLGHAGFSHFDSVRLARWGVSGRFVSPVLFRLSV